MPTEAEQQETVPLLKSWAWGGKSYPVAPFFKMLFSKGCTFVESIQNMVSIFKGKSSILSFGAVPGSASSPAGLGKRSTAQVEGLKQHDLKEGCLLIAQHPGSHKVS